MNVVALWPMLFNFPIRFICQIMHRLLCSLICCALLLLFGTNSPTCAFAAHNCVCHNEQQSSNPARNDTGGQSSSAIVVKMPTSAPIVIRAPSEPVIRTKPTRLRLKPSVIVQEHTVAQTKPPPVALRPVFLVVKKPGTTSNGTVINDLPQTPQVVSLDTSGLNVNGNDIMSGGTTSNLAPGGILTASSGHFLAPGGNTAASGGYFLTPGGNGAVINDLPQTPQVVSLDISGLNVNDNVFTSGLTAGNLAPGDSHTASGGYFFAPGGNTAASGGYFLAPGGNPATSAGNFLAPGGNPSVYTGTVGNLAAPGGTPASSGNSYFHAPAVLASSALEPISGTIVEPFAAGPSIVDVHLTDGNAGLNQISEPTYQPNGYQVSGFGGGVCAGGSRK